LIQELQLALENTGITLRTSFPILSLGRFKTGFDIPSGNVLTWTAPTFQDNIVQVVDVAFVVHQMFAVRSTITENGIYCNFNVLFINLTEHW